MTAIRIQESALNPADANLSVVLPAGEPWLHEVKQGQTLPWLPLTNHSTTPATFLVVVVSKIFQDSSRVHLSGSSPRNSPTSTYL